ncbi:MAG TPA: hypothetical protein VFU65_10180, partial [Actinocrinis sp.]|nr:hypothetical protein [Actinocrinis sp.]
MSVMDRLAASGGWRFAVRAAVAAALMLGALAGFGAGTAAAAAPRALPAGCSGSSPVTCHYAVSPGNYDVTVSLGSSTSAGSTA